jgi:endonuclease/exonuclease/phosphatase family metal-dependent hydrolase
MQRLYRYQTTLVVLTLISFTCIIGCEQQGANPSSNANAGTTSTPADSGAEATESGTDRTAEAEGAARPEATDTMATEPFVARLAESDLRVFNYNINSVYPNEELLEDKPIMSEKFARLLKATRPDIITLQEIPGELSAERIVELLNSILPLGDDASWYAYKGGSNFMDNVIAARFPLSMTGWETIPPSGQSRPTRLAYALVDLPDDQFATDAYVLSVHFKCCDGTKNDPIRQSQIDAIMGWLRDAKTPGDHVDIPENTAILLTGDMNTVGGPGILETAVLGNIKDEEQFGADFLPDWDDTDFVDSNPPHNAIGPDDYTWRNDASQYPPGRLDYVIYSDSVLQAVKKYILNTTTMSDELLKANDLMRYDVAEDDEGIKFDHLPIIVDFRPVEN